MGGKSIALALGGFMVSAVVAFPADATPVNFDVTNATLTGGSSYGTTGSDLNVQFSTSAFTQQTFTLDLPSSPTDTFQIGTVDLVSTSLNNSYSDLSVTATFTLTSPLGTTQNVTATGTAVPGPVNDNTGQPPRPPDTKVIDYMITWIPVPVSFGTTGQFLISLNDLTFTDTGTQNLFATFTLTSLDQQQVPVPEPTTLALLGGGLIGMMVLRRRVRRT